MPPITEQTIYQNYLNQPSETDESVHHPGWKSPGLYSPIQTQKEI